MPRKETTTDLSRTISGKMQNGIQRQSKAQTENAEPVSWQRNCPVLTHAAATTLRQKGKSKATARGFRDMEHRGTRGLPHWPCLPHAFITPSERHVKGTVLEGDTFPHREMRLEFLIKILQPERSHCMKPACRDKPVPSLKQSVTFRIVKDGQRVLTHNFCTSRPRK